MNGLYMDQKERVLLGFIKENLNLLINKKCDQNYLKELRRKYFIDRHKKKAGMPSLKEITKKTIVYLIKTKKIKSVDRIDEIRQTHELFRNNLNDTSYFEHFFLDRRESFLSKEDLSEMQTEEFLRSKEKKIIETIVKEKGDQIDEKIKIKEEELNSFPSKLDLEIFSEPEPPIIEENSDEEWWQALRLTSDPFPRQEGLDKIPEEFYEKIIYKNKLIRSFSDKIKSNRIRVLNKGTMILGNYGTGKSTFFDYISPTLMKNQIFPIRMTFLPENNTRGYLSKFETKLFEFLDEKYYTQNEK